VIRLASEDDLFDLQELERIAGAPFRELGMAQVVDDARRARRHALAALTLTTFA